jgi:hypothetical protein
MTTIHLLLYLPLLCFLCCCDYKFNSELRCYTSQGQGVTVPILARGTRLSPWSSDVSRTHTSPWLTVIHPHQLVPPPPARQVLFHQEPCPTGQDPGYCAFSLWNATRGRHRDSGGMLDSEGPCRQERLSWQSHSILFSFLHFNPRTSQLYSGIQHKSFPDFWFGAPRSCPLFIARSDLWASSLSFLSLRSNAF